MAEQRSLTMDELNADDVMGWEFTFTGKNARIVRVTVDRASMKARNDFNQAQSNALGAIIGSPEYGADWIDSSNGWGFRPLYDR